MTARTLLITAIALVFSACLWAGRRFDRSDGAAASTGPGCRIISMAPSITETLYALGLGDRVVGVTRYCSYPPETAQKPKTGGYYDPNFEAMVRLHPDLIVMLDDHQQSLPEFAKLRVRTLVVSHRTIEGILDSFRAIGRVADREALGRQLADQYTRRLQAIQRRTQRQSRPRVLLALDRTFGRGQLADVYVAGVDGYFDRILQCAGGQNVYQQRGVRNPVVSPEGVAWLNPDVIVDLAPRTVVDRLGRSAIAADWNRLPRVEAVRRHRVFVIDQDYALVPGPRFIRLVEDLAELLHPDVKKSTADEGRKS
ncbi:MAG: helical backbone metal receptor [Planctomycetaceae bacterium]|nr:helical backbone metal receptor [Planctomycetaceae bacterium]